MRPLLLPRLLLLLLRALAGQLPSEAVASKRSERGDIVLLWQRVLLLPLLLQLFRWPLPRRYIHPAAQ